MGENYRVKQLEIGGKRKRVISASPWEKERYLEETKGGYMKRKSGREVKMENRTYSMK